MKNIAKCKLCQCIIESFHSDDYVECKCGEIAVDGGIALRCAAKDWSNFLRIDDNGREVIVNVKELTRYELNDMQPYPNDNPRKYDENVNPLYIEKEKEKKQAIEALEMMIKSIKDLPEKAMANPITHYDFYSALVLLDKFCKALS